MPTTDLDLKHFETTPRPVVAVQWDGSATQGHLIINWVLNESDGHTDRGSYQELVEDGKVVSILNIQAKVLFEVVKAQEWVVVSYGPEGQINFHVHTDDIFHQTFRERDIDAV